MESKSGVFSNMQPGMLGLEMSLHHPMPPQNSHHVQQHQQRPLHPTAARGGHGGDFHPQAQQYPSQGYPYGPKSKNQNMAPSDDDEPGLAAENSADDGKRNMSPWQRMKWTDNMVKLLIMAVFYVGDEIGYEGNDPAGKKKGSGGASQKKGKWKSVSQVMMEKGFYVSPQQCEDKFNDLNKRYKRVNEILGKGTACRVVENQSLLDSMDHLSPKMKEEVRKLLNSKHLFFREMCAYHKSCGHGSDANVSGSGVAHHSPTEAAAAQPSQSQSQQQRCLHSPEDVPTMANLNHVENEASKQTCGDHDDDEDDEEDDDEDNEDEDDDNEAFGGGSRAHQDHGEEDGNERNSRKRARKGAFHSPLIQQVDAELANVLQDARKSPLEKRQWMKTKLMLLEEERVGIRFQAFELEKQRLKWLKFSTKKEMEMEEEKLSNERSKLENERMILMIRQQELHLLDQDPQVANRTG